MSSLHRFPTFVRSAIRPDGSDAPDRAGFLLLLAFVVVAAPIDGATLFASAPAPAARPAITLLAFLTACAALVSRSAIRVLRPLAVPLGAAAGLTLLGVAQLLPLPEGALEQIASVNLKIYHETGEILRIFGRPAPAARISIAPAESLMATLQIMACLGLFLAGASLLRTRPRRRTFLWAGVGGCLLLIVRIVFARGSLPAGWTRESLGTVFGIGLCILFGALWAERLVSSGRGADAKDRAERFERRFAPAAVRILFAIGVASGLILVRPPVAGLALALTLLLVLRMGSRRRRESSRRGTGTAAAAVLAALAADGARAATRLDAGASWPAAIWESALAAWRQFPIVGAGLGAFPEAFRRVQPASVPGLVDDADSSALQMLVTGGAVGFVLAAVLIVAMLVALHRAWKAQRHREESATCLAAFGALLFWSLQGLAAFNASPFAIPALLSAVLGCGWAAGQARGNQTLS